MLRAKWLAFPLIAVLIAIGVVAVYGRIVVADDWRWANRESVGIAPDPLTTREAVVQVYAARAYSWRGALGVHSWIAVKPSAATAFTVYEVIGWRAYRGLSALSVNGRPPDGRWFGAAPYVVAELRGEGIDEVIRRIDVAARNYPHGGEYRMWPGPNSNTFVAHVARAVPELRLDLPPTAIGKDFLPNGDVFARTPSGTGFQLSLFGLLGLTVGVEEGLEVNLLGLAFGVDPLDLAIKLPVVGRLALRKG